MLAAASFSSLRHTAGLLVLIALVVGGCRTYGSYDSEEKTLAAIVEANEAFAGELARAEAAGDLLDRTAAGNPALTPLQVEYRLLLEMHAAYLAHHLETQAELEDEWLLSYRNVSRAYGSIISEQNLMNDLYQEALFEIAQTAAADSVYLESKIRESQYYVVPPAYDRMRRANRYLTMESAIEGGRAYRSGAMAPNGTTGEQSADQERTGPRTW